MTRNRAEASAEQGRQQAAGHRTQGHESLILTQTYTGTQTSGFPVSQQNGDKTGHM